LTSAVVPVSQPLTALPSQLPNPALHTGWHALDAQLVVPCPFVHAVPQAPQFAVVLVRFTSQPVDANPSQLPKPALHEMEQVPVEQDAVPFVPLQAAPHPPQFAADVFVFVSQPLTALPSQFPNPALHVGTQAPVVQVVVPFAFVHWVPQAPQFERLVFVFVSQPLEALPSQLPNPEVHVPSVHTPELHDSLAFARLQVAPQSPQSVRLLMFRSQPLFGLPSQLLKLMLQVGTHAPAVHVVVPFAFVHAVPQAPQFVVVFSDASQPLLCWPSQLPKPELHEIEHEPRLHVGVAFAPLHTEPQVPQLPRLVSVFVSQPLFGLPSQFLKLPLQVGVHTLLTQLVVPLAFVHAIPQPPQLLTSAVVALSQPFLGLPSQSAKPAEHVGTQVPPVQVVVPCAFVHAIPQPPQLVMLVLKFASQPLLALPSQLPKPALHVGTQTPVVQVVDPLAFVQALPHAPQFDTEVFVLASQPVDASPSQLPKPVLQAIVHAPREQPADPFVPLQTVPHAPQFDTFVSVLVSQPLFGLLSQLPKPELHVPSVQVPLTQVSLAFARLQTAPHAPQFARLVFVLVSQPLPELPSQSPRPGLHVDTPQTAPTQFGVPPEAGHTLPHVLQLLTSEFVFVSQPLFGLPSQFLNPEEHVGTQAPPVQAVVPFVLVHWTPQAPQLDTVVIAVSQPLRALPSQLPNPALHVGTQAPAAHVVVPFGFVHASPQPPQFATDV
jgi:hypothetical protein